MNRCCLHLRNEISGALWGVLPSNAKALKAPAQGPLLEIHCPRPTGLVPHLQGSGKKEVAPKANEFSGRK